MSFWVVVADSSKARFLAGASAVGTLKERHAMNNEEALEAARQPPDSTPGRRGDESHRGTFSGGAGTIAHRSAMPIDPKEKEIDDFAREIAAFLQEKRQTGELERVSLVAPPAFLGSIRNHLDTTTERALVEVIDKNLVQADRDTIQAQLTRLY